MKIRSAYSRLRVAKGFTLMEILVVMVIIVVLATLTISIYTWLETRKNEQATESIVRKIEMGLESYHSDHDRYPYGTEAPFNNHGVAVANGEEYSSNVVYMALFGDHKNEGVPGRDTTIYNDELNPATQPKSNPTVREVHVKSKDGRPVTLYILADPWGSPYRYRLGSEQAIPCRSSDPSFFSANGPFFRQPSSLSGRGRPLCVQGTICWHPDRFWRMIRALP